LTPDDIEQIKDALAMHTAVVINDLDENPEWLLNFGRGFGPLKPHILDQYHHPLSSEMSIITANMDSGESRKTKEPAGAFWHSDLSYTSTPSAAIFLYATHVPLDGGDTMVASTQLAYGTLSNEMKARIVGLKAIRRYGWNVGGAVTPLTDEQSKKTPDVVHRVVRTQIKPESTLRKPAVQRWLGKVCKCLIQIKITTDFENKIAIYFVKTCKPIRQNLQTFILFNDTSHLYRAWRPLRDTNPVGSILSSLG
jgi:alpha-ketoglutarate-dependent taurine dioxygenase